MAKIGDRSYWLAVPAGLLCAAVVAALTWLALPMVPITVGWVGDTLRAASAPRPVPPAVPTAAERAAAAQPLDCRALYPDSLWSELTLRGDVLLTQTAGPPATALTSLADALPAASRLTCSWRLQRGGGIVTTLAAVAADAVTIADATLRGQGFTCSTVGAALQCVRIRGDVVEEHTIRAGLWLSSVETVWHPEDYGLRVAARVWG
jgi:hypothetical protein